MSFEELFESNFAQVGRTKDGVVAVDGRVRQNVSRFSDNSLNIVRNTKKEFDEKYISSKCNILWTTDMGEQMKYKMN